MVTSSFTTLRSHWDEIKHGAAAEERRRALRAGTAAVAAQAAAGDAAREAEACTLLVELAAGETRAWKEVHSLWYITASYNGHLRGI